MKVCVVGSGAREHALAVALARSADEVIVAPGNDGIAAAAFGMGGIAASASGVAGAAGGGGRGHGQPGHAGPGGRHGRITVTAAPATEVEADLVVIGPEVPLVEGLADRLRSLGRRVAGPGADGARLEGSKAWMKDTLAACKVPTASYGVFDEVDTAEAFLATLDPPYVVKTDGLAAGKGVLVTEDLGEARADVAAKLSGVRFGDAGRKVVIEEALTGEELSLLVLCDGKRCTPLAPARDAKRVGDGDAGPNTGGMGAFSPVPDASDRVVDAVMAECVEPLVGGLVRMGIDYRGVLYAGLMLTPDGPKIVEYNVRFGDPETQAILPRLDEDLVSLLDEVACGRLRTEPHFGAGACVTVVMAAEGYPGPARSGDPIFGLEEAAALTGVQVYHAASRAGAGDGRAGAGDGRAGAGDGRAGAGDGSAAAGGSGSEAGGGRLVTAGGRVLSVSALGADLAAARRCAYEAVDLIGWDGEHHRSDIALAASHAGAAGTQAVTRAGGSS